MSAAFQRVTLLLSRRMLSIFWTKSAFQLLQENICPLLIWRRTIPPLGGQEQCACSGTRRATIPAAARTSAEAAGAWLPGSAQSKVSQIFSFYCHVSLPLPTKKLLLLRPPAPTYPSAASTGRRNSISVSANSNLASMSSNTSSSMVATSSSTSRRRHVSMSSAASYGTPAASRGLPFYWT